MKTTCDYFRFYYFVRTLNHCNYYYGRSFIHSVSVNTHTNSTQNGNNGNKIRCSQLFFFLWLCNPTIDSTFTHIFQKACRCSSNSCLTSSRTFSMSVYLRIFGLTRMRGGSLTVLSPTAWLTFRDSSFSRIICSFLFPSHFHIWMLFAMVYACASNLVVLFCLGRGYSFHTRSSRNVKRLSLCDIWLTTMAWEKKEWKKFTVSYDMMALESMTANGQHCLSQKSNDKASF